MRSYRLLILIAVLMALAIYINLPNSPGLHIPFLGIDRDFKTQLGLDLVGGVQVLLEADLPETTVIDNESMNTANTIVENRVNGLGVSEALVQRVGERRIVVEIPGAKDPEQAIATVKQTGLLEFVDMTEIPVANAIGLEGLVITTDYAAGGETQAAPTPTPTVSPTDTLTATQESPAQVWHTIMTGQDLSTVNVQTDQLGEYVVAFTLSSQGARVFSDFTSAHIGQVLAIVLDKTVISAPRIDAAITDGQGIITGNFTYESANQLAIQLRYGSLPIPLKVIETRTIGPTLGQDSLNKSVIAGLIGSIIVVLFMILYYRLPGLVAVLGLMIYGLVTFAIFRYIPVTLTLPGIAGLMLSTGSALDSNILIFERMKEELRGGRTIRQAIDQGWQRAWTSIRDSNIATLLTCLILFVFGSVSGATIVKGFSITLAIGVGVSLFTAWVVTRTFLNLILGYFNTENKARWFGI